MKTILSSAFLIFVTTLVSSQVVINEFSASNLQGYLDSFGKSEDWIELYNKSGSSIDIGGWYLSDKESKPEKWAIPAGTRIPANGVLVFLCSGRDAYVNNEYHTNFKFSQTKSGEVVMLANAAGEVLEMHDLGVSLLEHSRCRITDGADEWAIATTPTLGESNDGSNQYRNYTLAPEMSLDAGYYNGAQSVALINNEPNSILRYTTNGDNPTEDSPIYMSPIAVNRTMVIKAQSFSNEQDILPGKMDFRTFFINEDYSLAVFSISADSVIDLANGQGEIKPIGAIEYFNTDKELEATSFGWLNRHGQDSWALDHRSIDWVSRDEMGYSKGVKAPLFSYSDRSEYQRIIFRNSGDDNYPAIRDGDHEGSTHIRDEYVQTLALEGDMKLDQRAVERVIVFLNGQYWGVYGMRERPVDHDYTDEYYDQGKYDIEFLSTWASTTIRYGGQQAVDNWANLRDYILETDMSDEAAYKIAEDSLNMVSLIDYFIVNLNVVASDWLNYNTGWWRGRDPDGDHKKWGYLLWDLDATFDYYLNYTGVPDTSPNAKPCDLEEIADFVDLFFSQNFNISECQTILDGSCPYTAGHPVAAYVMFDLPECCDSEWSSNCQELYDDYAEFIDTTPYDIALTGNFGQHEKIFLKLLKENETFKQLYYSRFADMMNTTFSCERMTTTLERMLDVIRPEMPGQIARWGGTMAQWETNVDELRNFIELRCQRLDDGMLDCYDELSGPHTVTLITEPDGIGEIDFNTLDIEEFPWTGDYFGGMENLIKAKVFNEYEDQYEFSHWESRQSNLISPNDQSRKASIRLEQSDTLVAVFDLLSNTRELESLYGLSIYPNPVHDRFKVEFELDQARIVTVQLNNMIGQKITQFNGGAEQRFVGTQVLDLNVGALNLASGIYMLQVRIDDKEQNFKLNVY